MPLFPCLPRGVPQIRERSRKKPRNEATTATSNESPQDGKRTHSRPNLAILWLRRYNVDNQDVPQALKLGIVRLTTTMETMLVQI